MKNIKTIIIIIVVGGLALLAYTLNSGTSSSKMADHALSDFAIKDTASINKIQISDTEGNVGIVIIRKDGAWADENGGCIQQHLVRTMLETIKYIKVKGPVSKNSIETINKNIAAHNTKLEIFQNGKLSKTWYIGDPTQDQYGTHMLLKDEENGKSPEPFIMYLPNMYGNLSTRFVSDPLQYKCTGVFNYDPLNIASISVEIPDSAHYNFKIIAIGENKFQLFNDETEVHEFDTVQVRDYVLAYRKIHFENYNYTLTEENIDSMKQSTPYYSIQVVTKEGDTNSVNIYQRKYLFEKYGLDGELLEFDQDRVWVELNDGTIVVGQYFVFSPLMRTVALFTVPIYY